MLTVNLVYDNYKGRIAIGRLYSGTLRKGMEVCHINAAGEMKKGVLSSVMTMSGLARVETENAVPGDVVAIAGIPDISIGETVADPERPEALPVIAIEEPTVKMTFAVNTSPFAGKEGQFSTSNNLRDRLAHELETDVALRVVPGGSTDAWEVSGRGELHLAILIEKMRREGFEFQVSKPQVILKETPQGKMEPVERVSCEVPEEFIGLVMGELGRRKGNMVEMRVEKGIAHLEFLVPTRGLIGFRNLFLTGTKGRGILNSLFERYEEYKGEFESNPHGSLVATESGATTTYGLLNAEGRGELFVGPGLQIYEGMIVGENSRTDDIRVNVCKEKQLSNMRAKSDGGMEFLKVPRAMTLEEAIEFIGDDELVEITPKSIRLRKYWLKEGDQERAKKGLL